MAITRKAAREELNRRATSKDHRGRWVMHVEGIKDEDEKAARQSTNAILLAKAGDGYKPVPRDDAWLAAHAPQAKSTAAPGSAKSQADAETGKAAFQAGKDAAAQAGLSVSRQIWCGKLVQGKVLGQGMTLKDATAEALAKVTAYVRVSA